MAGYGTSLAGIEGNYTGIGELVPGVVRVPADESEALARVLAEHEGKVAAFFGEPVIGAGGVRPPRDGYWTAVAELCRAHDVLLAVDEVITGFGRLGSWFASGRYGLRPDLLIGAKGVTSGYFPLGLVVASRRVQEPFWNGAGSMFRHGYTYSAHPTACAVGLGNLGILGREGLVNRGRCWRARCLACPRTRWWRRCGRRVSSPAWRCAPMRSRARQTWSTASSSKPVSAAC
jgi:adenosylmethionine-8-amino-7-oxononanoate aminotransferase